MTTVWSIAWRLATGRSAANTWRQIVLPVAIFCSVLIGSMTVSVLNVYWAQDHRAWARAAVHLTERPTDPTTPGLYLDGNADYWHGRQYIQNWIEPPPQAEAILPPGVWRLPAPGEAAVSPALAEQIEQYPELQARYPSYFVMDEYGITSPDELISWVRPTDSEAFLGQLPGFVTGFNSDSANPTSARDLLTSSLNKPQVLMFAALVVAVPSVFLLIAGMTTSSSVRARRIDVLMQLGAGRSWISRLNLLESLIFAIPIVLVILPLWRLVSERLTAIPVLDQPVFRGDMMLRWNQAGLICMATLLLIAIAAVGQVLLRQRSVPAGWQTRLTGGLLTALRIVLLIGALVIAFVGVSNQSERGIVVYMIELLVVLALLPSLIGAMARPLGAVLGQSAILPVRVAGERLRHQSARGLRPFVGLSTVIVVLLLTFGAIAFLTARLPFVDHTASPSSAEVITGVSTDDTVTALQETLPDTMVVPFYEGTPDKAQQYVAGTSCDAVAEFLAAPENVCTSTEYPTSAVFDDTFYYQDIVSDPTRSGDSRENGHVLVISHASMEQVDADVRGALPLAEYPGLRVRTPESFAIKVPPTVPWLERGATAFIVLTGLALVGALVDQSIARVRGSQNLVAVGAMKVQIAVIEGSNFLVCCLLAVAMGALIGFLELWSFQRLFYFAWSDVPVGLLFGVLAATISISAALVVAINTRMAFAEEEPSL